MFNFLRKIFKSKDSDKKQNMTEEEARFLLQSYLYDVNKKAENLSNLTGISIKKSEEEDDEE